MKGNTLTARIALFLSVLFLFAVLITAVSADDMETLRLLPGQWTESDYDPSPEDEPISFRLSYLAFEEDGRVILRCCDSDGVYAYSCEGTWSFEFVSDGVDRVTLRFTSTDDPAKAGTGWNVECVYGAYTESWEDNGAEYTALILEPVSCSGVSPFEELYGYDGASLYKTRKPNMRVVNCNDYVSLRAKPSKSSTRLAKVPLGTVLLAYPEKGVQNGFILCLYDGGYGYILAEYLEAVP